jgi:hypothetical protein
MDSQFFKRKRAARFDPAGNCGRRGQKRLRWIAFFNQLPPRKPEQLDDPDPAGQGFGHAFHYLKGLRTGQPEEAGFAGPVRRDLDVGEQLGRILEFIDQKRRGEALNKQRRVLFGKAPQGRIVQGNVGPAFLANVLNECRLADLPRPGDQQDRKQLAGSFKMVFQSSMFIIYHSLKTV